MGLEIPFESGRQTAQSRIRDIIQTIDSELRAVAALRRAARERGEPLPPIDFADALLDERLGAQRLDDNPQALAPLPTKRSA
jgi:hypothetical protein